MYVYMHIESGDDETDRNNESKGPPAQQKVHYHMCNNHLVHVQYDLRSVYIIKYGST